MTDAPASGNSRKRQAISWLVSILVSGVLLYYALRGVDWRGVWRTIATARLQYIAAAGAVTGVSFFLRAIRWRILLNAETWLSVGTVFWANMAGYLGNSFLPARAGELIRSMLISTRSTLSKTYVLTTALSERLMDAIALVLWSSLVLMGVRPKPQWMADLSRTMAILASIGAIAVMVLPHTGRLAENVLQRIPLPGKLRNILLKLAEQVLLGLRAFHHWGRFLGFVSLTVVIWFSDSCVAMLVAKGLGLPLTFPVAMLLLAGLGLGSALPSTPGYVGVYQFVAVSILVPFGISRDGALAYILVMQATGYVMVLLLGLPGLYMLQGTSRDHAAGDGAAGVQQ